MDRNQTKSQGSKRKTALHVLLALAVIGVFGTYVARSNIATSQAFEINSKKAELRQIGADVAARESALAIHQDMATLVLLAQQSGMIPGKEGETLFADGNVAIAQ